MLQIHLVFKQRVSVYSVSDQGILAIYIIL